MPAVHEDNLDIREWTGLNISSPPELLAENELTVCQNMLIGPRGELMKRPGFNSVASPATTSGTRYVLGTYIDATGVHKTFIFDDVAGARKTYWKQGYASPSHIEVTTLAGLMVYAAVQLNGNYYIATSAGVHKYTTGSTSTLLAGSPTDLIQLIAFGTQIFGIKGSVLYYTDSTNSDNWVPPVPPAILGGGSNPIYPGDGDNLTALVAIQDRILLFKTNSIWILYLADAPEFWQVRGVNSEIGCTNKKAVRNIRGLVYFMSVRGLWVTDGVAFTRLSDNISPEVNSFRWGNQYPDDCISVWDDYLFISMGSASQQSLRQYAYKLTSPRGFSQLIFGNSFEIGNWGMERIPLGNGQFAYMNSGVRPGRLLGWLPSGMPEEPSTNVYTETVAAVINTAPFNFDRVSRMKRTKFITAGINAPVSASLSYSYITDYEQIEERAFPKRMRQYESSKLYGPGFARVLQFVMKESSNTHAGLTLMYLNFVDHLHRQQIEGVK